MITIENALYRLRNGNDIRGIALETPEEKRTLTPAAVRLICRAFVDFCADFYAKKPASLRIGVGNDGRLTASELKAAALFGLNTSHTYDCGLISTPAMFQSTVLKGADFDAAIMLTASHLPANRNGVKFFLKGMAINAAQLDQIVERAIQLAATNTSQDENGAIVTAHLTDGEEKTDTFDLRRLYCEHMKQIIRNEMHEPDEPYPLRDLHIIVDAGNGAAGFFATDILAPLGADISGSVFLESDGTFPNHIPNPENSDAMAAAALATTRAHADLGVIFDCDGDRAGVVFEDGSPVNRNHLIALLAAIVAQSAPHSAIVTDSITSDELSDFLASLGLKHIRYKRGYKNVIDKAIECNQNGERCELAVETSGHAALRENHFSDDGAYLALKIIAQLARLKKSGNSLHSLIDNLKIPGDEREIRFDITAPNFADYGKKVIAAFDDFIRSDSRFHIVKPNAEGIRANFDDGCVRGWLLIRMSLHDPAIPLNIETKQPHGVAHLIGELMPFFARFEQLKRR